MKVVFYINGLYVGGAETCVTGQLLYLKKNGVDVSLVVDELVGTFLEKRVLDSDISITPLFSKCPKGYVKKQVWRVSKVLTYKKRWRSILRTEKPDLIHINTMTKKIFRIDFPENRMVFTFHTPVSRHISMNGKKNFSNLKEMAKKGMYFTAITKKIEKDIRETFSTEKVAVIPNFVDLASIRNGVYGRDFLSSECGIPSDSFVVGHVGRFHPVKNHEKVISVFSEIIKRKPNAYLILVGDDYEGRLPMLKERCQEMGFDSHVRFLGARKDAAKIVNTFDCFLFPSIAEGFGIALLEAQSLGVRCVASDIIEDDLVCNGNCIRLSLDAPDALWADECLGKSTNPDCKDVSVFDINVVMKNLISYYEKILSAGGSNE